MYRLSSVLFAAATAGLTLPTFARRESGSPNTKQWRLQYTTAAAGGDAELRSAWHDLPRHPTNAANAASSRDATVFTFVNEIPKGTRAKLEMSKEEPYNPIKQDIYSKKEGQPMRYFLYGEMPFNYGFIPQTWEDPEHVDAATKCRGDGDPIDVVHLGPARAAGVYEAVRVLGVLGLIDQGETDWKIIASSAAAGDSDGGYDSLREVPRGVLDDIVDWFKNYKIPDGKKPNEFAFDGKVQGPDMAMEAIQQCIIDYDELMAGRRSNPGYWLR